jgi:hypothetical protein
MPLLALAGPVVRPLGQLAMRHTVCRFAGHQVSWVLGVAMGFNRPVCARCCARL